MAVVDSVTPSVGQAPDANQDRWFTEEVQPNEKALRGYLHNRFPAVDTDDVVQESYLKLLEIRGRRNITKVKTYLFAIATHIALRISLRRKQLYSEVPVNKLPVVLLSDNRPNGAEIAYSRERLRLVAEAIDRLPARCRAVTRLAVVDGRSAIEIAGILDMSENTVRVQLARGIKKCSEYLRERGEAK